MIQRRSVLALAGLVAAGAARAAFPDRPIRLVVPFAAGGATDVIGRAVAQAMSRSMGQQIVIDNRPGAGGVIAGTFVANSPPDGYTLLLGSIGMLAIGPNLRHDTPYNVATSFAPVSLLSATPNLIVVHPSLQVDNLRQLIDLAKANPGKIAFGSSGLATSTHLSGELFQAMAGVKLVHVPYKGGAQALSDLMAGQIRLMFDTMASVPAIKAGKLKALAITSDKRTPLLPDVPTVQEAGLPGYHTSSWNGLMAPAATPRAVVDRLNQEVLKALAQPDVRRALTADGSEVTGSTPEEFGHTIAEETRRWGKLIRDAGIHVEQ
jgi:tripartite-type tricarboxylate transporter receptor subunit TctC